MTIPNDRTNYVLNVLVPKGQISNSFRFDLKRLISFICKFKP